MSPRKSIKNASYAGLLLLAVSGCAGQRGTLANKNSTPVPSSVAEQSTDDFSSDPAVKLALSNSHDDEMVVQPASDDNIVLTSSQVSAGLSLDQLEQLAISNNPTLSQQAAAAQEASAIRYQVGRYANPNVGYFGSQIADAGTDQHGIFLEQEFVTANKLGLNDRVLAQSVEVQRWNYQSQRFRVLTDVRMKFFQALAAQRRLDLIEDFRKVAYQGVDLAQKRNDAMEAAKTDVLQAKIQLNEVDVELRQAEYAYHAAWKELVAVVGVPNMAPSKLSGELPTEAAATNWDQFYQNLLQTSPEIQAARSKVAEARANLSRQEVQAIPNITANLGAGYDNGTNNGLINVQIGAPLPLYNKNDGNISAAYAGFCKATHEVRRLEMSIQTRLASVAREYDSALIAVTKYQQEILPQAEETLDLAEKAYNAGEFAFLQVLIVRRTFYEANLKYVQSLSDLATAQAQVNGLLLTGGLDAIDGFNGDDALRGQTFSQQ